MSRFLDTAEVGYKNACIRCVDEQRKFAEKNIKYENNGIVAVHVEDSMEIFNALTEIIHWAVGIYDRLDKNFIDEEDKKMMSGIKHIDNILKHTEYDFEMWNFLRMYSKHDITGKRNEKGICLNYKVTPAFQFQDISSIPCEEKWRNQRNAYNDKIKNKDMNEVISAVDKILKKYFIDVRVKGDSVKLK